jgi:1-acyl-sn-glycerol-3-phosphate acyltransferase
MNGSVLLLLSWLLLVSPLALLGLNREYQARGNRPEIRGWLRLLWWLDIAYCALWHHLKTNGYAPLPESGPAILIANHTCGIDHLVLQAGCRRVLGFMIAREYYESPWIRPFCRLVRCIPVNRDGRDIQATRAAFRALAEGRVLPVFPEGRITPASGQELGEIRPGAAFLAIRAGVPVIPAYIRDTPRTDQIGWSLITPSRARVTFGVPIDLAGFSPEQAGSKSVQAEVSERFRQALLELRARTVNSRSQY